MKVFKPNIYKKNVFSVDYIKLKEQDIKLLIFDLDNTLALVDELDPREEIISLINNLSNHFKILVASNNHQDRVNRFCKDLPVSYIYHAFKPTNKLRKYVKNKYNMDHTEVCIIGDQIVTDIYCGNRAKFKTILVDPLAEKDLKVTFFNRLLENKIKKRIKFVDGEYYEES